MMMTAVLRYNHCGRWFRVVAESTLNSPTSCLNKPDHHREPIRDRAAADGEDEGLPEQKDGVRHGVPSGGPGAGEWHRLNGTESLPKVIEGVRFEDGIQVIKRAA